MKGIIYGVHPDFKGKGVFALMIDHLAKVSNGNNRRDYSHIVLCTIRGHNSIMVNTMYRLGVKQIRLTRQQQDFVSAVSHELKTPLTSIRMYGEILREGWADEEKKKTYYAYIHDESERLSRLISNVLQLARMTRNELRIDLKPVTVSLWVSNPA